MNKRIRKKRRKAQRNDLQWAIETIKKWMENFEKKIREDPAKFREFLDQSESIDPNFKRRMIEYTYEVELRGEIK